MKLKGRTLLVLALLLFGGYAVYDYMQDKKIEDKKLTDSQLLTVNFEQIDQVTIDRGGQVISLKRSVDGWDVTSPLHDQADNVVADDFVKNVATEKIIDVAKEGDKIDWSTFGLDKPLAKITFMTTSGAKNSFEISEKRNFEENAFARRDGENRVLIVNSIWQNRARKEVTDFRDRRVLRHKIASIDDFKLKNKSGTLEVALKDGKWIVPNKKDFVLDQNKVREFLQVLVDAKASEFVDKMPALKSLFTLNLKLGDKTWNASVGQAADMKIYAQVSDPEFSLKLEPGALDKYIKASIEDLKPSSPSHDNNKDQAQLAGKEKR